MKKSIYLLSLLLTLTTCLGAQTFLQQIAGTWQGELEYSDYQTGKRVKLDTLLTIEAAEDGSSAIFSYIYDDFGRVMRSTETHRLDPASGIYSIDDEKLTFEQTDNSVVLCGAALDGNTIEPIRKTIEITSDSLTILKESRTPYQFRNRYSLKRSTENSAPYKVLTPERMAEDLEVLKKTLVAIHPGIYRYNTPAEIDERFAAAREQTKAELGEDQFFLLATRLVAALQCGHTYLNPLNQEKAVRSRLFTRRNYLPFYFRLIDRRMIVTGNLSSKKLAAGSEIISINGSPVTEIVKALLTITSADGKNTLAHRLNSLELGVVEENRYQLFDLYFPILFPPKDNVFTIEAIDHVSRKPTRFQVMAMTRDERFAKSESVVGKTPTYDGGWAFEIGSDRTAYLRISNSITWRLKTIDPKKFLDDAFRAIRTENIRDLVIDLRGNGGGDMEIGFELARNLADKKLPPYVRTRRLIRNVSAEPGLEKYLSTYSDLLKTVLKQGWEPKRYKRFRDGYFEVLPAPDLETFPAVTPTENRFTGNAYIISDAGNASATFQFLDFARENRLATIVGEETGGNRQGINGGNYYFLTLPNSRLEIDIPVYFQAPLKRHKDMGIVPDVLIRPSADDIAAGRDTVMERVKMMIGSRRR